MRQPSPTSSEPPTFALLEIGPAPTSRGIFAVTNRETGGPVRLRSTVAAEAFLGAWCDANQQVQKWLEIWVQRTTNLPGIPFMRGVITNRLSDERWAQFVRAFQESSPERCLAVGTEAEPQPPATLDGTSWSVCTDDAVLLKNQLEPYSSSLKRYRQCINTEGKLTFEPLPGTASFNPGGGRLLYRYLPITSLASLLQLMSTGQLATDPERPYDPQSKRELRHLPDAFLQGWTGDAPPLEEILFLKISLVRKLFDTASAVAEVLKRPMLNLSRHSWGVDLQANNTFLAAWQGEPVLTLPSAVVDWVYAEHERDPVYFLSPEFHVASIYTHPQLTPPKILAHCVVRVRELKPIKGQPGIYRCEGTIQAQEKLPPSNQLLLLDHPMAAAPIHAQVIEINEAGGEILFNSLPWQAAPETLAAIAAGGYSPPAITISVANLPQLGLAADLYALGVLGLEIFTCCDTNRLPRVLDELIRLAKRMEDENVPPDDLVRTLIMWSRKSSSESGWLEYLHPRFLTNPPVPAMEAWRAIPEELWFSVIVLCLRMLTGQSKYAFYQNLSEGGVSPASGFEGVRAELVPLLAKARGLTVMDWHRTRIIREEILLMLK